MKIVTVVPFKKGPFGNNLTYFSAQDIPKGKIVSTTLRGKKILGLVVSSVDATSIKGEIKKMKFDLKKINEIKEQSVFRLEFLESALETARYFASRENDTVSILIPKVFKDEYDKISKFYINTTIAENNKNIRNEKLLLQEELEERISFYKTFIRGNFAEKQSVFMVLPTHLDIEHFSKALSKGIEKFCFVLESNLTQKQLLENIKKISETEHPILICGTAPFLALYRKDIKTIIVEKESSAGYKTFGKKTLDLRVFAEIFASKIGAKFILADTLLRYDSLVRRDDNFSLARPINWRYRFGINIEILDRQQKMPQAPTGYLKAIEKFKVFEDETIKRISKILEKNKNIFIFTLRKGLATETVCRDCGDILICDSCLAPLVLYLTRKEGKRIFMCNKCNLEKDSDTICANCKSWNLTTLGIATDLVYEELKKKFPKTKIFKIDKEEVKDAKEAKTEIQAFERQKGAILVGTQMALPYLREQVELSIIASFDSLWSIPNYKMSEKVLGILILLAEKTRAELLIQTKNPNDEALLAFESGNLSNFIRDELAERKNMAYPPFKRFIKITHLGSQSELLKVRAFLGDFFKEYSPLIFRGFTQRVKDKFTTNALIKLNTDDWSLTDLSYSARINEELSEKLLLLPPEFLITVDPENLL